MTINELCKKATIQSTISGFHSPSPTRMEKLMLIVSELAEAAEELRKPGVADEYEVNNKPEGLTVELADTIIRVCDFCGYHGLDLESAIKRKLAYNATREFKHGKTI